MSRIGRNAVRHHPETMSSMSRGDAKVKGLLDTIAPRASALIDVPDEFIAQDANLVDDCTTPQLRSGRFGIY